MPEISSNPKPVEQVAKTNLKESLFGLRVAYHRALAQRLERLVPEVHHLESLIRKEAKEQKVIQRLKDLENALSSPTQGGRLEIEDRGEDVDQGIIRRFRRIIRNWGWRN